MHVKGTPHLILLKSLASDWLKLGLSPSSRLPLLSPQGKGTLRDARLDPPLLSVPVGSWREYVLLPYKAGSGSPGVTCHAIRVRGMSAMWGEWEVRTHPARSSSAENVHTHTTGHRGGGGTPRGDPIKLRG